MTLTAHVCRRVFCCAMQLREKQLYELRGALTTANIWSAAT